MARWHSCNVLVAGAQARQLWQFNATGNKFNLQRQESKPPGEPLPGKIVAKDWQTLFQPKLNIAWLPADKVFLRVVQLPKSDAGETQSMVELQLEKLSPLPVTQIVWSYEVVPFVSTGLPGQDLNPHATGELQTVIVIMASSHHVEEYLGQLEGQGYLTDRLELPLLDELRATKVKENGAWVFPSVGGNANACMVAWWYDGVLQNLSIIHLSADEKRAAALQEQLAQTVWAAELEGWLTSEPKFHLVANEVTASVWQPLFDLTQSVDVISPLPSHELAALTARRVAANGTATNLLPPEFATRYKQLFVDRLWMRLLGAVVMLYVFGVVVYFGFVQYAKFRYSGVQNQVVMLGPTYTNTIQMRERLRVLQDTLELQYAALECYKSVAETLPTELTLKSINFDRGRKVTFFGTASVEDRSKVLDFNAALMKHTAGTKNQLLYARVNPPSLPSTQPGQTVLSWNFSCDLKRTDATE
jgi:hypothetical protein